MDSTLTKKIHHKGLRGHKGYVEAKAAENPLHEIHQKEDVTFAL
jgi:hypothetical protein